MADSTLAALTDGSTAQGTDIIYAVRDPGGTPLNRKIAMSNVLSYIVAQANTWTAAQTFSGAITGASNVIEQRNSTNAQAFRVYNTYTDASNYERFMFGYVANRLFIGNQIAGTGADRSVDFVGLDFTFKTAAGTARWYILSNGHFTAATDNTYDIGGSGAFRPRHVYIGGNVVAGGTIFGVLFDPGANGQIRFDNRTRIFSPADGIIRLTNNAVDGFSRIHFGGDTSSFPALKRSSTILQARLADDSDFAPLQGKLRSNANATAETPTATHTLRIFDAAGTEYKVLAVAA